MRYPSVLFVALTCLATGTKSQSWGPYCSDPFSREITDFVAVDCNNSTFTVYDLTTGTRKNVPECDSVFEQPRTYADVRFHMESLDVNITIVARVAFLTNLDSDAYDCDKFYGNDGIESLEPNRDDYDNEELNRDVSDGSLIDNGGFVSTGKHDYEDVDDDIDEPDDDDIEMVPRPSKQPVTDIELSNETDDRDADSQKSKPIPDNRTEANQTNETVDRFIYIVLPTDDNIAEYQALCRRKNAKCIISSLSSFKLNTLIIISVSLIVNAIISASIIVFFSVYRRYRHYEAVSVF